MGRLIAFLAGLVGAITAVLLLLFRRGKNGFRRETVHVDIEITDNGDKGGGCTATVTEEIVELSQHRRDRVEWKVIRRDTNCPDQVRICVGEWKFNDRCSDAPTEDEDHEGHCKMVRRGHPRIIKGTVKRPGDAPRGDYKYSVLIDGDPVLDPIVRIVP